jgi:hypothetical protein
LDMRKQFPTGFSLSAGGKSRLSGAIPGQPFSTGNHARGWDLNRQTVHAHRRPLGQLPFVPHPGGRGSLPSRWGTKERKEVVQVNLIQYIPLLVIFAALLIACDLAQKYFVFRLIQKAKDKDEREAIIAALTRRWR